MVEVIQAENLTKYFGKSRGVDGLNLEVQDGEVFGFLGPNGAGKTTTIRLALDFIRPTNGSIQVLGLDPRKQALAVHSRTGYLPGELAMYGGLTGAELLTYFGNLRGGVDWGYVEELAERLGADLSERIKSLSSGNRHKIGLIQALMNKPELLILDEPSSRLDPLVQQEFLKLVAEVRDEGRTVFLSSHILPEVERVCDRVGIIREGAVVAVESVEQLKERALRRLEFHFDSPAPLDVFERLDGVRNVSAYDTIVRCEVTGSVDAVIKAAAQYTVTNVISHELSLEDIFLGYYNDGGDGAAR